MNQTTTATATATTTAPVPAPAPATKQTLCSSFRDLYYACLQKSHENHHVQGVEHCGQVFSSWTLCRQMCQTPDEKCRRFKDIIGAEIGDRPRPKAWAGGSL